MDLRDDDSIVADVKAVIEAWHVARSLGDRRLSRLALRVLNPRTSHYRILGALK